MNSVEPIRDIKTLKNMRAILKSQSTRNELLFILGINVGLRISDILKLKLSDLLKPNMKTIKEYPELNLNCYVFRSRQGVSSPIIRQQAYRILSSAAEAIGILKEMKILIL